MAKTGIIFGLLLCGLTVVSLFATPEKAVTQFVPMMFGIPLLFLGVVSLNPHRRPVSTWFAGGLAALGLVLGAGRLLILGVESFQGDPINMLSVQTLLAMIAACLLFVLGVGFWHRRRNRRRQRQASAATPSMSVSAESADPTQQPAERCDGPTRTTDPAAPSLDPSDRSESTGSDGPSARHSDRHYATALTDHCSPMDHAAPSASSDRNS